MDTKRTFLKLMAALCALAIVSTGYAQEATEEETAQEESQSEESLKSSKFDAALKERYKLTDEQIKALRDAGMNNTQITKTAQLSLSSGKTVDEISKMRLEQKMGWGKIAKELGVHPGELGKGVAAMKKDVNGVTERQEAKMERKEERKAERDQRKEERKAKQADKKQDRAERKEKRGKG